MKINRRGAVYLLHYQCSGIIELPMLKQTGLKNNNIEYHYSCSRLDRMRHSLCNILKFDFYEFLRLQPTVNLSLPPNTICLSLCFILSVLGPYFYMCSAMSEYVHLEKKCCGVVFNTFFSIIHGNPAVKINVKIMQSIDVTPTH